MNIGMLKKIDVFMFIVSIKQKSKYNSFVKELFQCHILCPTNTNNKVSNIYF